MEGNEMRWWTYFRGGQGETLGASLECVLRSEEERDRERKAAGQETTALMSRGGSSYIMEGWVKEPTTHGYFQQTQPRRSPSVDQTGTITGLNARRHMKMHTHTHTNTHTQSEKSAVCLLVLLFQGGQLCDSRRWHLSSRKPLIGSWQITQLPFHLSLTTITAQSSCIVWWSLALSF